jgi:hypothetical protein
LTCLERVRASEPKGVLDATVTPARRDTEESDGRSLRAERPQKGAALPLHMGAHLPLTKDPSAPNENNLASDELNLGLPRSIFRLIASTSTS